MKLKLLLALFAVLNFSASFAQGKNFWTPIVHDKAAGLGDVKASFEGFRSNLYQVNIQELKQELLHATDRSAGANAVILTIPDLDGKPQHYKVYEESNFAPELQAQYPGIRAYVGYGIEDPTAYLRISISHKNVQTMVLRGDGPSEFIEPYNKNATVYALFASGAKRIKGSLPFTCYQQDALPNIPDRTMNRSAMSDDNTFRTYRLALSCTAEYTQYHGGSVADALAAMNATMSRVNGVYEKDLAVKLELIANTTQVIYTSPSSDPYSNASQGSQGAWSNQLQNTLNNVIGSANYDIGHLFGATGGGGFAGCIGCVCDADKGSGFTSPIDGQPEGDTYDIDYVAHEMGHQLGANHTYSVVDEGTGVNIEPGSGSTIMGYAGITGATTDVQLHSDDYFAYRSIQQIQDNLEVKTCGVEESLNNAFMIINAGPDYTIPKGTAFVLRGVNINSNGANVTYTWEQNDDANNAVTGESSVVFPTKTAGPTFRSIPPAASPVRYMPAFASVLNNNLTNEWETVSTVGRTLNFTLTGRDNIAGGGQTATDAMRVFVSNGAGPFVVTSQDTQGISWEQNSTQTITWNVAGTNSGSINTAQVNILLSTDNGQTFTTVLAGNTANDGSEVINVPNISAPFCRIMIEAVGNIYYALNQQTFAIGYTVTTTCNTYTNETDINIPDGGNNFTNSTINIPENSLVSDVNVDVDITHPYVSDLFIRLMSPAGTEVMLWEQNCDANNGINATFDDQGSALSCGNPTSGNIIPANPLSAFNGEAAQGNWRLGVIDVFNDDAGVLTGWSLEICTQTVTAGINQFGLQNFSLYPNPNKGNFTVEFTSESGSNINILVYDIRGRQIYTNSYHNTGLFSGNVNLSNAEAGVYIVTVSDGARKEVKRIVVQ